MSFPDLFSGHASLYSQSRPAYPPELFQFLASQVKDKGRVWDCATGNGQSALFLAEEFDEVIATDASKEQLALCPKHPKIRYAQALAEEPPLADQSVDLITVAQAVHWFDLPRFYEQARRVLKPDGVIAVWCYFQMHLTHEIDDIIHFYGNELLKDYWANQVRFVINAYKDLPFPFKSIETPDFVMTENWDFSQFKNYLNTWSAAQRYWKDKGRSPVESIENELFKSYQNRMNISWKISLLVGSLK